MALSDLAEVLSPTERGALLARLIEQTRRSQEALVRAVENQVFRAWLETDGLLDINQWSEKYAEIVRSAQMEAHNLATAGFAEHVSLARGTRATAPAIALGSAAWLATAADYESRLAVIELNTRLAAGQSFEASLQTVGRITSGRSALAVQGAYRQAGTDYQAHSTEPLRGWRKVLSGGPCGWCVVVADQIYRSAESVSAHSSDRCGVAPVVEGDGWSPGALAGQDHDEIRRHKATPEAATLPELPREDEGD